MYLNPPHVGLLTVRHMGSHLGLTCAVVAVVTRLTQLTCAPSEPPVAVARAPAVHAVQAVAVVTTGRGQPTWAHCDQQRNQYYISTTRPSANTTQPSTSNT